MTLMSCAILTPLGISLRVETELSNNNENIGKLLNKTGIILEQANLLCHHKHNPPPQHTHALTAIVQVYLHKVGGT